MVIVSSDWSTKFLATVPNLKTASIPRPRLSRTTTLFLNDIIERLRNVGAKARGDQLTKGDGDVDVGKNEKISWTGRITNWNILKRIGEVQHVESLIRSRKKRWIANVLGGEAILTDVIGVEWKGKSSRKAKNW